MPDLPGATRTQSVALPAPARPVRLPAGRPRRRGGGVGPPAAVLALAVALYGNPVPRLSEELYLPLARHTGDPSFLRGDWTLSGGFAEHWLFDHLVGPLAATLPLAAVGWVGRLVMWAVLSYLLVRLGERLRLTPWTAAGAVGLWLFSNQALMGGDWVIGTFESKTVAYCFVLGGLLAAARRRVPLAIACLGLAVSFHPAVGLWNGLALGVALVSMRETRRGALRWTGLGVALALPGVIGALTTASSASRALDRFVVLQAVPYHLDPFFAGTTHAGVQAALRFALLAGMLAVNVVLFRRSDRDVTQRVLLVVQLVAAVPFVLGAIGRVAHWWAFMLYQPFRAFPLVVPLVFYLQVARLAQTYRRRVPTAPRAGRAALVVVVGAMVLGTVFTAPLLAGPRLLRRNLAAWTTPDPTAAAFRWVDGHVPRSGVCVTPVDRQDVFFWSGRPTVAVWQAIRYDALVSWKRRIDTLVGGPSYFSRPGWRGNLPDLAAAYRRLDVHQMRSIAARYHARCVVSVARYPFPVLHREDDVRVYRVR